MSWLSSFIRVISFGIWKEKDNRSDYFKEQEGKFWYWKKDILLVQLPDMSAQVFDAFSEWKQKMPALAPRLFVAADPGDADIVIEFGDAVKKGGVTVRAPVAGTDREIAWAKIVIAKKEGGKRLKSIALHEIGHALGLTHDGARDMNVMHSTATVASLDSQTINTLSKIYEQVSKSKEQAS